MKTLKSKFLLGISSLSLISIASIHAVEKPNIIVILTDDQGYGDLSCFEANDIKTPNIDKLAKQGIKLTDFHVAASISSPSRAAFLTGCYPVRVGIPNVLFPYKTKDGNPNEGLNPEEETIAELLKQAGYATGMTGKWHLGHLTEFMPTNQGFDEYLGLPYSNDMNVDKLPLIHNEELVEYVKDQSILTKTYTDFGTKFIKEHAGKSPFFLYVAHSMPHIPIYASDKFKDKSKRGLYGDVVQEIDWSVGEIMKAVKENGIEDNTLIIFFSDNGPWLSYGNHGGSNGVLRDGKFSVFEGGFRVPCVISFPQMIPSGIISDQLISSIDLLPTLCNLAGAKMPDKKIDGIDVIEALKGKYLQVLEERPFYYYLRNELRGVRVGDWKYVIPHSGWWGIKTVGKDGKNGTNMTVKIPESLYNLAQDISEKNNVILGNKEKALELKSIAKNFETKMDSEKRKPGVRM